MLQTAIQQEYRFYGFGNYYLSSLQQGLQAAHAVGELFTQHPADSKEFKAVYEWARDHKTMVLLNGGNSKDLAELYYFFKQNCGSLAFAKFHEDDASLCGALTYVGIILPSRIYDTSAALRNPDFSAIMMDDGGQPISQSYADEIPCASVLVHYTAEDNPIHLPYNEFLIAEKISNYRLAI